MTRVWLVLVALTLSSFALAEGAENAHLACAYEGAFGHGRPIVPGQPGADPLVQG